MSNQGADRAGEVNSEGSNDQTKPRDSDTQSLDHPTHILNSTSSSSSPVFASTCSVKRTTGSKWGSWDSSYTRRSRSRAATQKTR